MAERARAIAIEPDFGWDGGESFRMTFRARHSIYLDSNGGSQTCGKPNLTRKNLRNQQEI
jgi:hypothetical protein